MLSLELAPDIALQSTGENPHRPQRGQAHLVETHANVFVIRPSTPIIHISSSFLCCRFSLVARSQRKHCPLASAVYSAFWGWSGAWGTAAST